MGKAASIGWAVLLLVITPASAQAQGTVAAVASRLELTEKGVDRWLDALGVLTGGPSVERLLVVSAGGEVQTSRTGVESSVALGLEVDQRLLTAGAAVVLVHNHPRGASLSGNDLLQLAKPGVSAVVAVGHDRSIYIASRGPRYDAGRFEDLQYLPMRAEVKKRLREECGAGAISLASADAHFSHAVAMGLVRAGIIEYRAVLSTTAHASFEPARVAFTRVAAGAAGGETRRRV